MSAAPSQALPSAKSAWIVGPRYDLAFFSLSLAFPVGLWALYSVHVLGAIGVYLAFQLAFNMPHNVQTWTMSIFDRDDRAAHRTRYVVAFLTIVTLFGGAIALSPTGAYPWLRDALVYWGYYHLVRQHYGFLRLYERRMALAGAPVPPREAKLYSRYVELVSYLPLLLRFSDKSRMTIHVAGRDMWIRHPVLSGPLHDALFTVWLAVIVAACVHHAVAAARGRKHLAPRAFLLAAVTAAFGLAGLVVDDIVVAIALVTSFHNAQYLGLTWFHNTSRAAAADDGVGARNVPIGWLKRRAYGLYALMTFGYGVAIFLPRALAQKTLFAELPIITVVALHYYVDSKVWRFQDYPDLARYLKLRA